MAEIGYFLAYTSYIENISELTDAECGRLFKALLHYTAEGEIPKKMGNEKYVFPGIKAQIDRDIGKYREKCRKLSENRKSKGNKCNQMITNEGKEKENESESEIKKENEKDIYFSTCTVTPTPTQSQSPTLKDIEEYCKRKELKVNPKRFFDIYTKSDWHTKDGKPIDDWYSLLENWDKTEIPRNAAEQNGSFTTDDFFDAALRRTYEEYNQVKT